MISWIGKARAGGRDTLDARPSDQPVCMPAGIIVQSFYTLELRKRFRFGFYSFQRPPSVARQDHDGICFSIDTPTIHSTLQPASLRINSNDMARKAGLPAGGTFGTWLASQFPNAW